MRCKCIACWLWNAFVSGRAHEHGRRKWGICRGSDTPTIYVGDIDMYTRRKYLLPSHANCMQHVLRCWERQSDGTEYKKTLQRPGLRPGPRLESLQHSRKPPSWWGGAGYDAIPPQEPYPRSRSFVPRLSYPPSKISSDTVAHKTEIDGETEKTIEIAKNTDYNITYCIATYTDERKNNPW